MTNDRVAALKARVCDAINDRADEIIDFAKDVQAGPELSYKGVKTTERVVSLLEGLDLDVGMELAVIGAHAYAGSGDFVVTILGEPDALVSPDHPMTGPETGMVHAYGHNAQLANLVGTTFGLVGSGIMDDLDDAVEFVAAPAEEYPDLGYQRSLLGADDIEFFGGKQELIRRGYVDDWDAAAMIHVDNDVSEWTITSGFSTNGFVGKFVAYRGIGAHAGAAPEEGVNALDAVILGMNTTHTQRERFRDGDHVRVHLIITRDGDGASVVLAEAAMESHVHAASVEAVADANESVNRMLASGAMGVGGDAEIEGYPGYILPRIDETMVAFYDEDTRDIISPDAVTPGTPHLSGSTDMGDITQFVPDIHPWTSGFEGTVHARGFRVIDEEMAYIIPAKLIICTPVDLLTSPEAMMAAREVRTEKHSREEYFDAVQSFRATMTESYRD